MYTKIIYFLVCKWPDIVAQEGLVTYLNIYGLWKSLCDSCKTSIVMYQFSNAETLSGAACGDVKFLNSEEVLVSYKTKGSFLLIYKIVVY